MSRSSKIVENPCKYYLSWDSDKGQFKYWDKDSEKNIEITLPFRFAYLDELSTIKGYSDEDQSGIWSNEVRNLKEETISVRTKKGEIASGLYDEIKDEVGNVGGKYTKSLYIAVINDNSEPEIWNIQLKGAAFSGWLEFMKKAKRHVEKMGIECYDFTTEKKGKVTYTVPQFKLVDIDEKEDSMFRELDLELQDYLKYYFTKTEKKENVADGDY